MWDQIRTQFCQVRVILQENTPIYLPPLNTILSRAPCLQIRNIHLAHGQAFYLHAQICHCGPVRVVTLYLAGVTRFSESTKYHPLRFAPAELRKFT